jgi:hypothetical protein
MMRRNTETNGRKQLIVQAKGEKMELLQLQEDVPRLPGILPDVRAPLLSC